jgi:hypothetical protein
VRACFMLATQTYHRPRLARVCTPSSPFRDGERERDRKRERERKREGGRKRGRERKKERVIKREREI